MSIKIGMLSFAHMHAHGYASCLKSMTEVEIVGIWDDDPERGSAMANAFNTSFFDNVDELLDANLDAVIICSENANHRRMTEVAAPRVRHILCEKPLASSLADAFVLHPLSFKL